MFNELGKAEQIWQSPLTQLRGLVANSLANCAGKRARTTPNDSGLLIDTKTPDLSVYLFRKPQVRRNYPPVLFPNDPKALRADVSVFLSACCPRVPACARQRQVQSFRREFRCTDAHASFVRK